MIRLFASLFTAVSGVSVAMQNATAHYFHKVQKHNSAHISTKSIIQAGAGMAATALAVDNLAYSLSKKSESSSSSPGNGDCPDVSVRQAFDWANTNNGIFFCERNPQLKSDYRFVTSGVGTDFKIEDAGVSNFNNWLTQLIMNYKFNGGPINDGSVLILVDAPHGDFNDSGAGLYNVARLPVSNASILADQFPTTTGFTLCTDQSGHAVPCVSNCTQKTAEELFTYIESKPESLVQVLTPGTYNAAVTTAMPNSTIPANASAFSNTSSKLTGTYRLSHKFTSLLNIQAASNRFSSVTCVPLNVQQIDFSVLDWFDGWIDTLYDDVRGRLTFIFLKFLEIINLGTNRLTKIDNFAFNGCEKLQRIIISNQQVTLRDYILTELEPFALHGLPALKRLDVNNNALSTLPEQLFRETPLFENLQAFTNRFTHFPLEVFAELPKLANIRLGGQGNSSWRTLKGFPPLHNQIDIAANQFKTDLETTGIACITHETQARLAHALQGKDLVKWRLIELCETPFTQRNNSRNKVPVDSGNCATDNQTLITQYLINIANDRDVIPFCS